MTKEKKLKAAMSANPTQIPWPTDKWGMTKELRKAVLMAASRLRGDADKKALLDETLNVAAEFIEVNFESSVQARKKAVDKIIAADKEAAKKPKAKDAGKAKVTAKADGQEDLDEDQIDLFDEE